MANIFHIERTDNKITLGATGTTIYIGSHTASKILALDASKELESVTVGTGLDYTRPDLTLSHLGIEALTDPGADKILFWDDTASACKWLGMGNSVAITDVTLDTIQDIRTTASPTFANLSLTETGANDPTLLFTSATNSLSMMLDESAAYDMLHLAGQTATTDTLVCIAAVAGQTARFHLEVDTEATRTQLLMGAGGNFTLQNMVQDGDIIFGIDDGGVAKTITWDGATDTLIHSAGTFVFSSDITLTGTTTPTLTIESTDASDPTLIFKTTNTTNQLNIYLDESQSEDYLRIEGQTALVDTVISIRAQDGENCTLELKSGAISSFIRMTSDDDLLIKNTAADNDISFQITDGGVQKTITWDADVDMLKHTAGTFNFHDDHLTTTGNISAGDIDASGELDVAGDSAFGPVSPTALTRLSISKHVTITSAGDVSNRKGIHASVQVGKTGLADYTGVVTGISTQVQLDDLNTQDWTNANAIRGFNADINTESSSAGTVTGISGMCVSANIQDAATVTNFYGYKLGTLQAFGNKLINAYGIHLSDVTAALTLNYAIYTGAGLVHFGDDVDVTGNADVTGVYKVDSTQVVSNRGAAVADATDAATTMARLNDLLARCRAHGLITT